MLEAQDEPGGAMRTAEVTVPGFRNDLFSAFYPLAAGSSVLADLGLEHHGLVWAHSPAVVAHPTLDSPAAVLHRDPSATAASLDAFASGDGDAWLGLFARWCRLAAAGGRRRPSPCCRCAGSPTSTSGAGAAACSSPATPSTPTCRPTPRPAGCWAGCSRRSARTSASRCRLAGPAS